MVKLELQTVNIKSVKEYPGNARKGNLDELKKSLEANGQYKPIVVQKSTSFVLAGNNTLKAAKALKWSEITAVFVEVDDNEAKRINLADNRTSDLATYDMEALADLLAQVSGFDGTGYTIDDLDDLMATLEEVSINEKHFIADPASGGDYVEMNAGFGSSQTTEENRERYLNKATRMLVCDYQNNQYIWLMEQLASLRKQYGLENNSATIAKLVEEVTGNRYAEE